MGAQAEHLTPAETSTQPALAPVLEEYLAGAQLLFEQRDGAVNLSDLRGRDLQLDACIDGLRIAGNNAWKLLESALAAADSGVVFVATVLALESKHTVRLKQILALAETDTTLQFGVRQAFSWVPEPITRPLLPHLMASGNTFYQGLGLHLYHQHHIHADTHLEWAITHAGTDIRDAGLTTAGELGATTLLPVCLQALQSEQHSTRFAAARAALLLGENTHSLSALQSLVTGNTPYQAKALTLLAVFLPLEAAQSFLTRLRGYTRNKRLLVRVAGDLGDPVNIPALLRLMADPELTRLAAYAVSCITGLDLIENNMDAAPPEDFAAGPNDDPEDENVESDPDEELPWPDRDKLVQWWEHNGSTFKPGKRYQMGRQINHHHCLDVLQFGSQAQRSIAALHLKKLDPAAPLFLTEAPAWRQQTRLAQLRHS
ncbi:MAG: TIGR02270 family protein [Pseudomonadota bacterium]|nr:TIGR02270 family protein [Pseudomonadota bacterium]